MRRLSHLSGLLVICCTAMFFGNTPQAHSADAVSFEMHRVGDYRGEPCGVGDFNADGKLDIVGGPYIYMAPDWKKFQFRQVKGDVDDQGKGYRYDFMNLPLDLDGDGKLEVVSCSWHDKWAVWFRNTGTSSAHWPRAMVEENGNFECGDLLDIDGDGKAMEILPHVQRTVWYALGRKDDGTQALLIHPVAEKLVTFGGGAGDINGDGRPDIVRPGAWYEAPADPRTGEWKEHPLTLGHIDPAQIDHTPQILVHDINGDGLADILTSSAHKYGIFWYQQVRAGEAITWKRHLIDKSWSQAHSLALADLDGDSDLDLITGKRFMAHNGHDPGSNDPIGVYWYELKPGRTTTWTKHVISYGEGIGSGMNIPVVDLDADGDLDIVVTGKWGGPVWFENKTR
jgi:hypothetical protein